MTAGRRATAVRARAPSPRDALAAGVAVLIVLAGATRPPTAGAAGPAASACTLPDAGPAVRRIVQPGIEIAWRPSAGPIEVGRPFSIEFVVCPQAAPTSAIERLTVDAWMPAHRHGMNYRPTLTGALPGPLRADGLLFHMPGRWQVVFELRTGERALRLTDDLTLR